jgi:putative glutamine amidotransferase
MLTGGEDINPIIYGETPLPEFEGGFEWYSDDRDAEELEILEWMLNAGVPVDGICRGAQLMYAHHGGRLLQHIDNHSGDYHKVWDVENARVNFMVNSLHHQCGAYPTPQCIDVTLVSDDDVIEAWVNWEANTFGVQYHPEWLDVGSPGRDYFIDTVRARLLK